MHVKKLADNIGWKPAMNTAYSIHMQVACLWEMWLETIDDRLCPRKFKITQSVNSISELLRSQQAPACSHSPTKS